jgi:HAD superfamily hydrolase (TIGR01509 family)
VWSHWIFDMDGTLTIPMHDFDEIRRQLGIPPEVDILQFIEEQDDQRRKVLHRELEDWERSLAKRAVASEDALVLLEHLKRYNHTCGVLTRNTRALALITLKAAGLSDFFDPTVVLGRDSAPPKPSPAGILQLLSHWGVKPEDSVMIGDDINDLIAGKSAGCTSVFVYRNRPLLERSHADILCRDLRALMMGKL